MCLTAPNKKKQNILTSLALELHFHRALQVIHAGSILTSAKGFYWHIKGPATTSWYGSFLKNNLYSFLTDRYKDLETKPLIYIYIYIYHTFFKQWFLIHQHPTSSIWPNGIIFHQPRFPWNFRGPISLPKRYQAWVFGVGLWNRTYNVTKWFRCLDGCFVQSGNLIKKANKSLWNWAINTASIHPSLNI